MISSSACYSTPLLMYTTQMLAFITALRSQPEQKQNLFHLLVNRLVRIFRFRQSPYLFACANFMSI